MKAVRSRSSGLGAYDIQIYHDRILAAADNHRLDRSVGESVDLLVRYKRGNIDKIARVGFGHELQMLAPAEAGATADDVEHGFQFAVVVRSGRRARLHDHRPGPEFLRSRAGIGNGSGTRHAGCLRCIGIQLASADDANAMLLPIGLRSHRPNFRTISRNPGSPCRDANAGSLATRAIITS